MRKTALGILFLLVCASVRMAAQTIAVKSNLLYDATSTFNLSVEAKLSCSWSVDLSANYNPWTFKDNKKWKHFLLQPELRYWTQSTFKGHFFGVHVLGGKYNAGGVHLPFGLYKELRGERHQGQLFGTGVAYGYAWTLGCRWGVEAELGLGYVRANYDRFSCEACGKEIGKGSRNYVGPTKLALNLVYVIGGRKGCGTQKELAEQAAYEQLLAGQREEREREAAQVAKRAEEVRQAEVALAEAGKVGETVTTEEEIRKPEERQEQGTLYFPVGKADLLNRREMEHMDKAIATLRADSRITVTRITITAYASPEGTVRRNEQLSRQRADNVLNHCRKQFGPDELLFSTVIAGEDWQGLAEAVAASQLSEKDEILQIINIEDIARRKANLERLNGGRPYFKLIREVYPGLRRVICKIEYSVKNR